MKLIESPFTFSDLQVLVFKCSSLVDKEVTPRKENKIWQWDNANNRNQKVINIDQFIWYSGEKGRELLYSFHNNLLMSITDFQLT